MAGKRRGRHPRNDLDAKRVASLLRKKAVGRHFDGQGLHLFVKPSGTASWVLRVTAGGRRKDIGLGSIDVVSLVEARERARQYRAVAKSGGDPIAERRKALRSVPTFEQAARRVHAEHAPSWRNAKHGAQWLSTLETYAFPMIGALRTTQIDVPDVLRVLSPIWLSRPETARRVRQRIRTVLDWARAAGHRDGENPVGPVLAKALPRQSGARGHHAALSYVEVPVFIRDLRESSGGEAVRLAFEFLILTAARTSEVLGARKDEIDLEARVWSVAPERMKAGRSHRVPLSPRAVEILERAFELSADSELVFQGARAGQPISTMAFLMLIRRMGVAATAHGFRSSFRDWAAETTAFPSEVVEMALAHAISDKTEAAYRRGDLFEKRRKLMEAWESFVTSAPAEVLSLNARRR